MKEILKFEAKWCVQCKVFSPIINDIVKNTDITLTNIDVEENELLTNQYNIRNLPTIIFLKDDKEVGRSTGILTKEALSNKIKEYFND